MTSSDKLARSAADRISVAFNFDSDETVAAHDIIQKIRAALVERIILLLNVDPAKLMATLYRIDVRESVVNEIFKKAVPPDVPDLIADLIIERQLSKARTRAEHSQRSGEAE